MKSRSVTGGAGTRLHVTGTGETRTGGRPVHPRLLPVLARLGAAAELGPRGELPARRDGHARPWPVGQASRRLRRLGACGPTTSRRSSETLGPRPVRSSAAGRTARWSSSTTSATTVRRRSAASSSSAPAPSSARDEALAILTPEFLSLVPGILRHGSGGEHAQPRVAPSHVLRAGARARGPLPHARVQRVRSTVCPPGPPLPLAGQRRPAADHPHARPDHARRRRRDHHVGRRRSAQGGHRPGAGRGDRGTPGTPASVDQAATFNGHLRAFAEAV